MRRSSPIPRLYNLSVLAVLMMLGGKLIPLVDARVDNSTHPDSFISSANYSSLPPGAFIVPGLTSALDFAQYLEDHPEVIVKQLLVSDSNVWDTENNYGFLDTSKYYPIRSQTQILEDYFNPTSPSECDDMDIPDEEADMVAHNTKLLRKQKRLIRDHPAVMDRILNHTHSSLETFAYLLYMEDHRLQSVRNECSIGTTGIFNRVFPRLRALTVTANSIWIPPRKNTASSEFEWELPSLDNLTHLHVIGRIQRSKYHQLSSYRAQFPNLTHIRLTGSNNLPSEFYPTYDDPSGIWQRMTALWHGTPLIEKWSSFPEHLNVIIQPEFPFISDESSDYGCGCRTTAYDSKLDRLDSMQERNVYLSWPIQSDWLKFKSAGVFPLHRAISNFKERVSGGAGEWEIGEELERERPREAWWKHDRKDKCQTHEEL